LSTADVPDIPFYHGIRGNNPLTNIPDFDKGNYWSIDADGDDELKDFFEEDPDDDSFILIPKSDVLNVWFVSYDDGGGRPHRIR
jgi:hypothetical protein